jgi:signal transduction histidine kinase
MDLKTDLPGPPGIGGRASARICCDPAFGFADQSMRWAKSTREIHVHSDIGSDQLCLTLQPAPGRECQGGAGRGPPGRGDGNLLGDAAWAAAMTSAERDRFMEGCLKIQEDERLRLGRELHDSTGQLLLALRLEVAQLKGAHGMPGEDQLIDEIEQTASQIDREIRSFAFLHYPAEIERDGLGGALAVLVRGFAARTGIRISFADLSDHVVEGGPASIALLRVAQEALMNVHRHARAVHARVSLSLRKGLLELVVRDDGIGLSADSDIAKFHGVGLLGMRHRVERLGGRLAIKRMKHGTKLTASVPLA